MQKPVNSDCNMQFLFSSLRTYGIEFSNTSWGSAVAGRDEVVAETTVGSVVFSVTISVAAVLPYEGVGCGSDTALSVIWLLTARRGREM